MGKTGLKVLIALLVASAAYTLLGSLAGSYVVERKLQNLLAPDDQRSLQISDILFNPFTLAANLDGMRLADVDGASILTVESAHLNFSMGSLFREHWVLNEVSLKRPELTAILSTLPRRGVEDLFANLGTLFNSAGAGDRPEIGIVLASVQGGRVLLRDDTDRLAGQTGVGQPRETQPGAIAPFELILSEVNLHVSDYGSGSAEPARLEFSTRVNEGGTLRANGHFVPKTGAVEISVQLADLDLARFNPLLRENSMSQHLAGWLRAEGQMSRSTGDMRFAGKVAVEQLVIGATPRGNPLFNAGQLLLKEADIMAWPLRASAGVMELDEPQIELEFAARDDVTGEAIGTGMMSRWLLGAFAPSGKTLAAHGRAPPGWPPRIDSLVVRDGRIGFTDLSFNPSERLGVEQVAGQITRHTSQTPNTMTVEFSGTPGAAGTVTFSHAVEFPNGQIAGGVAGEVRAEVRLPQDGASLLAAYFARITGREFESGALHLDLRYRLNEDALTLTNAVSFSDLVLGGHPGPASMPRFNNRPRFDNQHDQPLELAIALLTDPSGETRFEPPVLSHQADSTPTDYAPTDSTRAIPAAFKAVMTEYLADVSARPFAVLGKLVGYPGEALGTVIFSPGSAAISPLAEQQLHALSQALSQRPALRLRAFGEQASRADRTALARGQLKLHVALAASTRPTGRPEQEELDFSDVKVQAVLDEFAATRLTTSELARLKAHWQVGRETGAMPEGYYAAIFDALAPKEPVADNALRQLARFRAQSVIRSLESLGIASERLQQGTAAVATTTDSAGADDPLVALEVFAQTGATY